ncbi:MAG: PIN domain-containing protein [Nanoarchaeota archaeon]
MKELFTSLQHKSPREVDYYLDTCFLFHIFTHNLDKDLFSFCNDNVVAVSSFTIAEFLFHHHDMPSSVKKGIRHSIHSGLRLFVVDIDVSPGHPDDERSFVSSIEPRLLSLISDPSDAVLFALALDSKASVITRDKHHLFTTALENYAYDHHVRVLNKIE